MDLADFFFQQFSSKKLEEIFNQVKGFKMDFDAFVTATKEHQQAQTDQLTDIAGDITALHDLVASLKNQPGTLSSAQQATLDELDAATKAIVDRMTAVAAVTPPNPAA